MRIPTHPPSIAGASPPPPGETALTPNPTGEDRFRPIVLHLKDERLDGHGDRSRGLEHASDVDEVEVSQGDAVDREHVAWDIALFFEVSAHYAAHVMVEDENDRAAILQRFRDAVDQPREKRVDARKR